MQYFRFPHLGPAPDGSDRKLRFDLNAMCDLEDAMDGASIYRILADRAGFNFIRHLLWAGLKWNEPSLTPRKVGELIQKEVLDQGKDLEVVVTPALEALRRSGVLQQTDNVVDAEVVDLEDTRPTQAAAGELGDGAPEKAEEPPAQEETAELH